MQRDSAARLGLTELYLQHDRGAEWEAMLAELEPLAPMDAAVLRARWHLAHKEYEAARQLLLEAIRQALKRLRVAIAAAQAGRLHCPHDVDLLLLHGALLQEDGDAINAERVRCAC